jgi:hypothetical protein
LLQQQWPVFLSVNLAGKLCGSSQLLSKRLVMVGLEIVRRFLLTSCGLAQSSASAWLQMIYVLVLANIPCGVWCLTLQMWLW